MNATRFRIFNSKSKKWVYRPYCEVNLIGETILLGGFMDGVSIEDLDECKVLQYVGLKDKNGQEIYEGDILALYFGEKKIESKLKWEVTYLEDRASFGLVSGNTFQTFEDALFDDNVPCELEVIGNIFGYIFIKAPFDQIKVI